MAPMPVAINQDIKALFPRPDVAPEYLLALMRYAKPRAEARAIGSTVLGISTSDYLGIKVPLAPSCERPEIAEILTLLGSSILDSIEVLRKLEQLKQGLLHDVLRRGIDSNGELRAPHQYEPTLYYTSLIGSLPNTWRSLGLSFMVPHGRTVIRTGPFGSSLKGEHWRERGRPVVTIGSLGVGEFVEEELLFVDEQTARRLADYELVSGDVVFSRVADVGRSVVVKPEGQGWIMSSNLMRISVDAKISDPQFLQFLLAYDGRVRKQIRSLVNSAGRDVANSETLMALRFPMPLLEEQTEIVRKVNSIGARIAEESRLLRKLLSARSGLTDDLLTGRVRVTSLLEK